MENDSCRGHTGCMPPCMHAEISPAPCSCRPCHNGTTRMRFNLAGYEESTAVCSLPPQAHRRSSYLYMQWPASCTCLLEQLLLTIRNTAEAIFEWHACRVCCWNSDAGRRIRTRHGEEREKLVEKAMSSVRLDEFSENRT